jgi:GNAT superfamily N-acetyltransferase
MADETIDQKLRDMAEHRGLKLLKSRKRKPGSGDYGKFGLTDAQGAALLGVGDEGLTATPEDIEAYLRKGATSNWKASAATTPARPQQPSRVREKDEEDDKPVIRPRRPQGGSGLAQSRRNAAKSGAAATAVRPASPAPDKGKKAGKRKVSKPIRRHASESEPRAILSSAKPAHIALAVRIAKPSDAADLSGLLHQLTAVAIDELGIARNLEKVREARGGTCVAEKGGIIGCCSWITAQTLQHGMMGRISLLLVDKRHRRQGIASAMLDYAFSALIKAGCSRVEVMSDIEISNAHNFFRTLKFEQTSYRFARDLPTDD